MKKILPFLLLCLSYVVTQSQPTLLKTEMLQYGAVINQKYILNLSVIDTTIKGTGVTWNFSSITNDISLPDLNITIVNPASTPYAATYTNSNYCYKETTGSTTYYRYFNLASTKMERVGSYTTGAKIYDDPQVEYVFPMAYGTSNLDTWDNNYSSTGGTYQLKCIGTGTLITPSGTYNALMVRVNMNESFSTLLSYFWYSSDNGSVLLQYIVGDDFFIPSSGNYQASLKSGIEENDFITNASFNNPVNDIFSFRYQSNTKSDYTYTVMNTLGQIMIEGVTEINPEHKQTLDINMSNLPAGLYVFSLKSTTNNQFAKTYKIIKN